MKSHFDTATSKTLVQRVKENDQQAWADLVRLYMRLVCYWCIQAGADSNDVPDLAQQVFAKVSLNIAKFRHEKFRAWLRRITIHTVRDKQRSMRAEKAAVGGTEAWIAFQNQAEHVELDERENQTELQNLTKSVIQQVQSETNELHWKAFWMRTIEGKPAREVSDVLGISVDNVHKCKSRILKMLRQKMADANIEIE